MPPVDSSFGFRRVPVSQQSAGVPQVVVEAVPRAHAKCCRVLPLPHSELEYPELRRRFRGQPFGHLGAHL